MKNNKGFTLVEVLAMLVVLGIIIGVTVPNITGILSNQKTNLIAEDGIKMITNAKNEFIVSEKVKYPEDGKCVIFTLDRLDKNSDIENGIEGGKYNKTKSFVTVKRVAKSYQYSVRLIEQLSNGKLYGISNASESSLNSETKKNFLGEIKEDYIVDFSSAKTLDDAKNALASDNVGGCTKDILTGFYN